MSFFRKLHVALFISWLISLSVSAQTPEQIKLTQKASKKLEKENSYFPEWKHLGNITIDSVSVLPEQNSVQLFLSTPGSYMPIREKNLKIFTNSIKKQLGKKFRKYNIQLFSDRQQLESLIPNYYRTTQEIDSARLSTSSGKTTPLIRKVSEPIPINGLNDKHIALWHSHGRYYDLKLDRWEWQRARLHTTVEDIFPMTFVLPYLAPMLENAGATVFLPRERDFQINEVIVDNDGSTGISEIVISGIEPDTINHRGFAWKDTLKSNENPFLSGSYLEFSSSTTDSSYISYIPDIPEDGDYAVSISYSQSNRNISNARYSVYHSGGKTEYLINQQMGGGTWIYLGTFHFFKGINPDIGSVKVSSKSNKTGLVSSDAIRFGGGMGNVARKPSSELVNNQWSLKDKSNSLSENNVSINPDDFTWKLSNKPRYMEAARYYLQYAGMPDTLVYSLNAGKNDYNDDYQSRGEWVNYLMGDPNGPTGHRNVPGLKIPIDLSLAFHTDAGVTPGDSIIGTLGIYSSVRDDGIFPNGQSKMASRDMSDIIQTQIVNDLRATANPDWTRRGLWNKQYSEAYRANVPTMLLELLSHQNLADMQLGLDPRFRFIVSRSIYKGILRFLAFQEGKEYTIHPLAIDHFSISLIEDKTIRLSWKPVKDRLEPTADPKKYKVYKRIGKSGFDNGIIVNDTSIVLTLSEYSQIVSYKITALNNGGESFPSEILSVGIVEKNKNIALIVNAFNRICGPAVFDNEKVAGIVPWKDQGVPDKYEFGFTGSPYDFNRNSPWLDDDSPGWGASYGNSEGKIIPGNSFDFTYIHGEAIMAAGHSFVSVSDESFNTVSFNTEPYSFIDIFFGEEKSTSSIIDQAKVDYKVFSPEMRQKIVQITNQGGNLLVSGAYIASDFIENDDTLARNFAKNTLHYTYRTNYAVRSGNVYTTDFVRSDFKLKFNFNTDYHPVIYSVEAPDALEPSGKGAKTAFRYSETNSSAGVLYKGDYKTVVLGFPFETILDREHRIQLMKQITRFLVNYPGF